VQLIAELKHPSYFRYGGIFKQQVEVTLIEVTLCKIRKKCFHQWAHAFKLNYYTIQFNSADFIESKI
jgi:hypothetical protein